MSYDLSQPADPRLAHGDARCPGPSTRDIILRDPVRAPDAILEQSYAFLGDADLPFARYTSPAFHAAEFDRLCRESGNGRAGRNTYPTAAITSSTT